MELSPQRRPPVATGVLLGLALAKLLAHFTAITQYGYFRDELYYIACSRHLAWGYVDQPPLSIAALAVTRALLGDSLVALRLLPALLGAATVFVSGLLARELGGGRFAQALTAVAVGVAPVYLSLNHFYSMNAFDLLFWPAGMWLTLRALATGRAAFWLGLGVVLGLGLLNKISMLWFGGGLFAGLLLTSHRRALLTPWAWVAGGIAALMFAPHVLWQVRNDWPTLEFMRNATQHKMVGASLLEFLANQVLLMSPASLPLWLGGLLVCLLTRARGPWRLLAVFYLTVAAVLLFGGRSRAYYLSSAYPMLFAAGAVAFERWSASRRAFWRPAAVALVVVGAVPLVPYALPVLPVERFVRYQQALGLKPPAEEHTRPAELPQHYADMFGWEEFAQKVARVYQSLSLEERTKCVIFAQDYGQAGAIEFFGRKYGLPRVLSGHNNYWLWGPRGWTGEIIIVVGGDPGDNARVLREVQQVATVRCEHCMPYERDMPIYLCRGLKVPMAELWRIVKLYI